MTTIKLNNGRFSRCESAVFGAQHIVGSGPVHTKALAPIFNAESNSIYLNEISRSPISYLVEICRPVTVIWFVISVIVDSVNAVLFRWARSHVCIKIIKTIKPSFADPNPSSSVKRILMVIRIVASTFHCCPSAMFWCVTHIMSSSISVATKKSCGNFFSKTTTTERGSSYVGSGGDCFVPAIAFAFPHNVSRTLNKNSFHYQQAAESFPFKIKYLWHGLSTLGSKLCKIYIGTWDAVKEVEII